MSSPASTSDAKRDAEQYAAESTPPAHDADDDAVTPTPTGTVPPFAIRPGGSWAAVRAAGVAENMLKRRSMLTTLSSTPDPSMAPLPEAEPEAAEKEALLGSVRPKTRGAKRDVEEAAAVLDPAAEARPRRGKRRRRTLGGECPLPPVPCVGVGLEG